MTRQIVAGARVSTIYIDGMNDRQIAIAAKKIAVAMRERGEIVARHLGTLSNLGGLCHFMALGVTHAMHHAEIPAHIASDGGHSWTEVELSTGLMLVDVTASQFGFADVFVRMPSESRPAKARPDRPPTPWEQRRRGGMYRRPMYETRATELFAQRLIAKTASQAVILAPPAWFLIEPHALPLALVLAGTQTGSHPPHFESNEREERRRGESFAEVMAAARAGDGASV